MATISIEMLKEVKNLYYEKEFSMREIAEYYHVSIDSVVYFMRKYNLNRRNYSEECKRRFIKKERSYYLKENLTIDEEKLKLAGVMLYWGEGAKSKNSTCNRVDFANSNPAMNVLFLNFLRKICGIREEKLRVYLYCYSNQDPKYLITYWSTLLQISPTQFSKPYVRMDFNPLKTGKMSQGMVHIRYSSIHCII